MMHFKKMNLLEADVDYICHQVNCQGKMNSGVAKAIRERWPINFTTYISYYNTNIEKNKGMNTLLGDILFVNPNDYEPKTWPEAPIIINMFGQFDYGYDGKRYTSYDAFDDCLQKIKETVPKGKKIAFPYKIGCDRGGGKWNIIFGLIRNALSEDYDITFCYLEEDAWIKTRNYLTFYVDEWEDK